MTLLVVDDQAHYHNTLNELLKLVIPESKVYSVTESSKAVEMIPAVNPDAVLLDVNMPGMNGLQVALEIRRKYPNTKLIANTNVDGDAMVMSLMGAGISGFLLKNSSWREIKKCLETVISGGKYFCSAADEIINRNLAKGAITNIPKIILSERETQLLKLLEKGRATKEISDIMKLKEVIVKDIRKDLLRKTNTKNAAELVSFALRNGLI